MSDLSLYCRDVPDFPKKGVIFKDITVLLKDADRFKEAIDRLGERYIGQGIDIVASVESRGFIVGSALAYKLGAGLVPVRKKGKLPWKTYQCTYDLEYGTDTLEIHQDAVQPGQKVLIVDDLIATGGTSAAVIELVKKCGGEVYGLAFLIELTFLKGREKIRNYPVFSLIQY